MANNKVNKKDLARSQVFSLKNAAANKPQPSSLLVNKHVDREEAMAGLALLNKHEQAMKRYEGKVAYRDQFNKMQVKSQWSKPAPRSPSQENMQQYKELINEPDQDYQVIQFRHASCTTSSIPDTNKEVPEPFNATQSFQELSKQVKGQAISKKEAAQVPANPTPVNQVIHQAPKESACSTNEPEQKDTEV